MDLPRTLFRLLLGRRLPQTSGTLTVPGLKAPIAIQRDGYGIPYIEARNDADAWFGLGFCQGQDRSFQLDYLVRAGRGRLAELVGPEALPIDRLARRIGFYRAAHTQLKQACTPELQQFLGSFAAGVNAGRQHGQKRPAHEFTLLRGEPLAHEAADVLALLKLVAFLLSSNWDAELARYKVLTLDGPEALAAIDPHYPEWQPTSLPPFEPAGVPAVDHLAADLAIFQAALGTGGGSNGWAVSAARAAGDRPNVSNDPHMAAALPAHFYLAHVRTPSWTVAGAVFAGSPGFGAGFNAHCAWSVTAGLADNTDLYLEEIGPDGLSVRRGDSYEPATLHKEVIQVKDSHPRTELVLETDRGPIVGPAFRGQVGALSLQATWLQAAPISGLLRIHRVRSVAEFREAFRQWPAVSLNFVVADVHDGLGWQLVGRLPQRRAGHGTLPLPASDPAVGWQAEPLPFEAMPHSVDPPLGFLATANNRPLPAGQADAPFVGVDFIEGYRQSRIVERLAQRHDWDLEGMLALQLDVQSLLWRDLGPLLLEITPSPAADKALTLLRAWDGRLSADSSAATVFICWVEELIQRAVQAKAPRAARWALQENYTDLVRATTFGTQRGGWLTELLRRQPDGWFERSWPAETAAALETVVERLTEQLGPDPGGWAWGRARPLTLKHPFGQRPPLDRIFNLGPFPWQGSRRTVSAAVSLPGRPLEGPTVIASLRMVVRVGAWADNAFSLPGGQSGNPLSRHYRDLLPFWRRGKGVSLAWTADQIADATVANLRLRPDRSR